MSILEHEDQAIARLVPAKTKKFTPENRGEAGARLKNGVNPSVGRKTQFQPGKSGNPGGRPKNLISDATRDWLRQIDPNTGKTNAEIVASAQGRKAKKGHWCILCTQRHN